jgi:beta-phosphoglucomutase-like phosphatase (HAD superfamily)
MFDADGVLFDSTESNTAYYNAIYALMGEPPMSPDEEKLGVFMAAPQIFELRAQGDRVKFARMREIARTMDATPFFNLMRPPLELRPFLSALKLRYRLALGDQSIRDHSRADRPSRPGGHLRRRRQRPRQGAPETRAGHPRAMPPAGWSRGGERGLCR